MRMRKTEKPAQETKFAVIRLHPAYSKGAWHRGAADMGTALGSHIGPGAAASGQGQQHFAQGCL